MTRCSVAAQRAGDPLEATAPPAEQWLLVEHAGPWGRHALTESRLDPGVAEALAGWALRNRSRVALIRRPRAAHRKRRIGRWFRVDSRPGRETVRAGRFSDEAQLIDVLADPSAGEPSDEPIYLVCTHGRHDTCCALLGRPVADALLQAFADRTWECTHVGGDRFAANLVLLPHGLYYGQVPPDEAVEVVKSYQGGTLHTGRLRGRSSLPAPVQAAQHHARLVSGEVAVDAYPPLAVDVLATDLWQVRLAGPDASAVTVTVRASMRDTGRPLTCTGTAPDRFRVFDLVDLRPG